ncbi:hypothetical protein TrST_g4357 [Triparma strigata]|uniref:Large ribosomal subunit protein uL29m n=1 Tax=Triparma strigata TaxID=1606541 RepID=A0A9W7B2Z2_9STRA|nr:hypothetical protein TrST_g4357 [Triparma strigata]
MLTASHLHRPLSSSLGRALLRPLSTSPSTPSTPSTPATSTSSPSSNSPPPQGPNSTGRYHWIGPPTSRYKVPTQLSNLSRFFPSDTSTPASGRSWSASDLRKKSFSDLHKLHFTLYREYNLLWTEQGFARRSGGFFENPGRKQNVKKSMAAIKQVLGERKREIQAEKENKEEE